MTTSPRTWPALVAAEISVIVGLALSIAPWSATSANATIASPGIVSSVRAPSDVALNSPWFADGNGVLWALGTTSAAAGTLVSYSPTTESFTTKLVETGDTETLGGSLHPSTNTAVFSTRKTDGTIRISVFNLLTGSRVTTRAAASDETNTRVLTFNSAGTYYIVGTSQSPAKILKFDAATSNANGAASLGSELNDVTAFINNGNEVLAAVNSTPVKLVPFNRSTLSLSAATTLPANTPSLVDPLIIGTTAYLGSTSTPGRVTVIDIPTRTVIDSVELAPGETEARNLAIDSATGTLYLTTTTSEGARLVSFAQADLTRLGHRDLGGTESATTVHITSNRMTVGFTGSRGMETLTLATEPNVPTNVTVSEHDRSLTLSWDTPVSAEPVLDYVVTARGDGTESQCTTTDNTCTLTGLTNGLEYRITVVARSIAGASAEAIASARPFGVPDAPRAPRGIRGDGSITVEWDAPVDDGGRPVIDYTATATPSGLTCVSSATSCEIMGLPNGIPQTIHITARNDAGSSTDSSSSESVTPAGLPGAPGVIAVTGADGSIGVTWAPPLDDGGDAVLSYRVRVWSEAEVVDDVETEALSADVTGLSNGVEYRVTVNAVNSVGIGAPSEPGFATPFSPPVVEPPIVEPPIVEPPIEARVPSAPSALAVIRQTRTHITVGWTQLDSGSSPVDDYRVLTSRFKNRGFRVVADTESSTPSIDIVKPKRGSLFVRVIAVNTVGESQPSTAKRVFRR